MRGVDAVVMSGSQAPGGTVAMVDGARRAIARDLVDKVRASGAFRSTIVSTNDPALAQMLSGTDALVELDPPDEPFHFGRALSRLIERHAIERVVYLGAGCAPLLPPSTLTDMAEQLRAAECLFVCNNFYSVDFCGFVPASALPAVEPPENDNALGWVLGEGAGLPAHELPRTTATSFDVDTPTDLIALSLHPEAPPHARTYLDGLALNSERMEAAIGAFVDKQAEVLVSGRVGSRAMAYLERETACRTRVFSEERGMRADGRLARGEVRSLLGMQMEAVGVERFFAEIVPQLGDAAFLDDRVLWAHHGVWPEAEDRFNSDLLRPDGICDPFVRGFTAAAMGCPVPVVLGGHSLVAGGLYVLVEAAWKRCGTDVQRPVQVP
jgi:CTP:molybdopterin cytidylyltransferase MocA